MSFKQYIGPFEFMTQNILAFINFGVYLVQSPGSNHWENEASRANIHLGHTSYGRRQSPPRIHFFVLPLRRAAYTLSRNRSDWFRRLSSRLSGDGFVQGGIYVQCWCELSANVKLDVRLHLNAIHISTGNSVIGFISAKLLLVNIKDVYLVIPMNRN
jgi:hypothetical protein